MCEEIVRVCLVEKIDSSNFLEVYNKVSEVKEKLYDISVNIYFYIYFLLIVFIKLDKIN